MSLAPMKFGTVKGRFLAAVGDSADLENDPDAVALSGEIEFIPQASAVLVATGIPDPVTVLPSPISCGLDPEGYLVYPKGGTDRTVRLVATDDPAQNPSNWNYEVKYRLTLNGRAVSYASYNIEVPAGVTTDLTLSARVPSSTGQSITRGIGVVDVQSSDGVMTMLLSDGTTSDPITLPIGPVGPPPELSIGTVITGPPTPGTPGPTGATGPKGDPGGIVASSPLASDQDLNVIVTPGLYGQSSGAAISSNYPENQAGVLLVTSNGPSVLQQYTTHLGNIYARRLWTGTWSPWRSFAFQRVSQVAGRAIYTWDDLNKREQLIYGDTGWRDVSAVPEWVSAVTSGADVTIANNILRVRRMGHRVHIMAAIHKNTTGSFQAPSTFPVGWKPYIEVVSMASNSALGMTRLYIPATGAMYFQGPTGLNSSLDFSFVTNDAWPSVLPGTAMGPIPNL